MSHTARRLVESGSEARPLVLCVDDQPLILKLIQHHLAPESYRLRLAVNAEEALAAVKRERPDLILLDIKLPDIDGYELCPRLLAIVDTPIVFVSAVEDGVERERAIMAGAVGFLAKPFSKDSLLRAVRQYLGAGPVNSHVVPRPQGIA